MRRFTRLTNGFSKKVENHAAMVVIHFLNYNMIRKHATIKTPPAVAAGVLDKPMTMLEAVETYEDYRAVRFPVVRPKRYSHAPTSRLSSRWRRSSLGILTRRAVEKTTGR